MEASLLRGSALSLALRCRVCSTRAVAADLDDEPLRRLLYAFTTVHATCSRGRA